MRYFKTVFLSLVSVSTIQAQISVIGSVDHLIPDGIDNTGNITLKVSGGTAPYSYLWNPGGITTKDISNKSKQNYSVKVTDSNLDTAIFNYRMGYKVLWDKLQGGYFRNDSISGTGFACSKNTLLPNEDGWFEYVQNNFYGTHYFIGFTDSISPVNNVNDITYGIFSYIGIYIYFFENGNKGLINYPVNGDVVRVERIGDVINYKINGIIMRSVTANNISEKTLKLKCSINSPLSLVNVGCSFMHTDHIIFNNYTGLYPVIRHSSAPGIADGGINVIPREAGLKTYEWGPKSTTKSSITSVPFGAYSVAVKDSMFNQSNYTFQVGYKTVWDNLTGGYFRNDTLAGPTYANSKNVLMPNTDGWFEYVEDNFTGNHYHIGFADSTTSGYDLSDIDYGFYSYAGTYLYSFENGVYSYLDYAPRVGDIIRIERMGNTINYKLNGVIVNSVTYNGLSEKSLRLVSVVGPSIKLVNVGCSFSKIDPYTDLVTKTIRHASTLYAADGSITLGSLYPSLNYMWVKNCININGSIIDHLPYGRYQVSATDPSHNINSNLSFDILYKTYWNMIGGCTISNDNITSVSTGTAYGTAYTKNDLLPNMDGQFSWICNNNQGTMIIGFADILSDIATNTNDIDYGIYQDPFSLYLYMNGAKTFLCNYKQGAMAKFSRNGNTLNLSLNDITINVGTLDEVTVSWKLKIALSSGNSCANIGCDFALPSLTVNSRKINTNCNDNAKGSINLYASGGSPPYTYVWSNGATEPSIANLVKGTYSVTVTDATNNSVAYTYFIDSCIVDNGQTPVITFLDTDKGSLSEHINDSTDILKYTISNKLTVSDTSKFKNITCDFMETDGPNKDILISSLTINKALLRSSVFKAPEITYYMEGQSIYFYFNHITSFDNKKLVLKVFNSDGVLVQTFQQSLN